jgi:hypothetical protein
MKSTGICFLLLLGIVTAGCDSRPLDGSNKIEHIRKRPLKGQFMLEGEDEISLRINRRIFNRVRGYAPYYLVVSNSSLIYFVTDGPSQTVTCHFYDTARNTDTEVVTDSSELGYGVCSPTERRETAELAGNDLIRITRFHGGRKTVYVLNLRKKQITDAAVLEN